MFKTIVEIFIKVLSKLEKVIVNIKKAIREAYNETYTESIFKDEVVKRKKKNKDEFIEKSTIAIMSMTFLNKKKAKKMAEFLFYKAKKEGDLDELDRLKGVKYE